MSKRPLTIYATDSSGAQVYDPLLEYADGVTFRTQYPGGLYSSAEFLVPYSSASNATTLRVGYKIAIHDGPRIVWEGVVDSVDAQGEEGARVECIGYWAAYFERRSIDRRWADDRLTEVPWQRNDFTAGNEKVNIDRQDRLRFTPKNEAWGADQYGLLTYYPPNGETVGRVTLDYDFQEGAQNWMFRLRDQTNSTNLWQLTASGTGTRDDTLSPESAYLQLQYWALASQTPTASTSVSYYGEVTNIMMYAGRDHASATLGNVNAYEVTLDIVDRLAVDETLISANLTAISTGLTLSVKPFYTNNAPESYSSILARICEYGDSSQNSIGYGLRRSQLASDSKPLMFLETYPVLTDYDYEITMEDGDVRVRENADDVWNYIIVKYTGTDGLVYNATPADDANLTDATSVSKYGQREKVLQIGGATEAVAVNYGRRYLARHKDPTWAASAPVRVTEILSKAGGIIPGSQIEAGKRLRIVDLPDRPNSGILGVNFIIVSTDYDNDSGVCSISLGGTPDDLGIFLAQQRLGE